MKKTKTLTFREQAKAVASVASISYRASPSSVIFKLFGALIDAGLPIVTTYFAALTTTELANAYSGDTEAGHAVFVYIAITAGLGLLMTVWRSIDQYVQAKLRYVVEAKVSDRMYDHFLALDFWRYDDKQTADLYDRAKQFSRFFAYVFDKVAGVVSQFIAMVVGVIALGFVNVWLALFVLVSLIPGVIIQFKLSRTQIKHWNENVETRRKLNMIEWQMLEPRYIAELRLYGMVRSLLEQRADLREKDERLRIEYERQYMPKRLASDALEAIAEVGALVWITLQIVGRAQPVGQFLYVQQVVSRTMSGASGFVNQLSSIDEDLANLFDYEQFMQLEERRGGAHSFTKAPEIIELKDVSFRYLGEDAPYVLKDVNMTIKKNQHIAIVGENGAGKSTFIKLLAGLYNPTSGEVAVDGVSLRKVNIESWHKQLGILQQEFLRYGYATAGDNIRFGDAENANQPLDDAMDAAEARSFIEKLPQGLDNYVLNWMEDNEGNKGKDLSGGQWQRLALARSFFRDAPVIVLDEPTSAIDALAEARIFERLFKRENKTIITISHRVTTIEKADVIYMFEEGRIVESGTHEELVKKRGKYYTMFRSQLRSETVKRKRTA